MEEARVIYETLLGARCSDSNWAKTKKTMDACGLPKDYDGFSTLIGLRKCCPRYFRKYAEIKEKLTAISKEIKPKVPPVVTGGEFVNILAKCGIKPNQSTISRWFKNHGGFKANKQYDTHTIYCILGCAFIYKARKTGGLT